jgi:hypothetical protein
MRWPGFKMEFGDVVCLKFGFEKVTSLILVDETSE